MKSYDIPCSDCHAIRVVVVAVNDEDSANAVADYERRRGSCEACLEHQSHRPTLADQLAKMSGKR